MNTKRKIAVTACLWIVGLGVVAVIAIGLLGWFDSDNRLDQEPAAVTSSRNTTTVTRTDFVKETEVDGTLGFGDVESLPNLSSGIVTWLPEPGSVISFGDVIYKINDEPIILLRGTMPMFRDIDENTSSALDIAQLQTHFFELGLSDTSPVTKSTYDLSADRYVTSITLSQIERWQESVGADTTGVVKKSQVVFRPKAFRVDAVTARLGQPVNGGSLVNVTETRRIVTVHLDTELSGLVAIGDIVEVDVGDLRALLSHLLLGLADADAGQVAGDEEGGHAARAGFVAGAGHHGEQRRLVGVGDVAFRAGQAVDVAVAHGTGLHRAAVAADIGLGQRKTGDDLTCGDLWQP